MSPLFWSFNHCGCVTLAFRSSTKVLFRGYSTSTYCSIAVCHPSPDQPPQEPSRRFTFFQLPLAKSSTSAPPPLAGGWLQQASVPGKEAEARALLTCLDPGSVLFQSLLAVDRATSVRFVFPPARLPDYVRRLLASSQGAQLLAEQAPLFQGAIMQDAAGRFQVSAPPSLAGCNTRASQAFPFFSEQGPEALRDPKF